MAGTFVQQARDRAPHGQRIATAIVLLACLLCSLAAILHSGAPYQPPADRPAQMRDVQLYQSIAASVAEGKSYYEGAVSLQRQNGFPVQPFFTVRLPTLTILHVRLGGLIAPLAWTIFAATLWLWYRRLLNETAISRVSFIALIAIVGGSILSPTALFFADIWCGLLISLALAFPTTAKRAAVAVAALALREFAAGFVAICLLVAVVDRDRKAIAIAIGVLALFLVGLVFHATAVARLVHPGDPVSQGWAGMIGPAGVVNTMMLVTPLQLVPRSLAALLAFLPLLGWLQYDRAAFLWFAAMLGLIATASRPDNFYWIGATQPLYFAGLAFVPRALGLLASPGWTATARAAA